MASIALGKAKSLITCKCNSQAGCLLVELHDSRPPAKGSSKPAETSIAKYVLRPTPESLWADIRNTVDSQKNWGDKEALELEARLVVCASDHFLNTKLTYR